MEGNLILANEITNKIGYLNKFHLKKFLLNLRPDLYFEIVELKLKNNEDLLRKLENVHNFINLNKDFCDIKLIKVNPDQIEIENVELSEVKLDNDIKEDYFNFINDNKEYSFRFGTYQYNNTFKIFLLFNKIFFDNIAVNNAISHISDGKPCEICTEFNQDTVNNEYWDTILDNKIPNLSLFPMYNINKHETSSNNVSYIERILTNCTEINKEQFFASFLLLIRKYSQRNSFIIGYQLEKHDYNRGMTLPILFSFDNIHTIDELLLKVNLTVNEAIDNYQPLSDIIGQYDYKDSLRLNPRFQVLFSYMETSNFDDIAIPVSSDYLLHVIVLKGELHAKIRFVYNEELINKNRLNYFGESLEVIVNSLNQLDKQSSLNTITTVGNEQSSDIIRFCKGVSNPNNLRKCLHTLFEETVAKHLNFVAIKDGKNEITYKELNEKANQLAYYLIQDKNIEKRNRVGICLERSIDAVVAMLAILKSGAAYVPIDPNLPMDRIIYMMEDSELNALITNERFGLAMPVFWTEVVLMDVDVEYKKISAANLNLDVNYTDDCYIIYTSGSTGKPKGAILHHEGVCNRILWGIDNQLMGDAKDVILHRTTLSFDVAVWEIFGALLSGGKLVILNSEYEMDISKICNLIIDNDVTHIDFVPSQLKVILEDKNINKIKKLKRITSAGETLSFSLKEQVFSELPCKLFNLYGPTEASLAVTYWECDNFIESDTIPIGIPMDNTEVYVLDEMMDIVPFGVTGEIYIGGICVGNGYWNNESETNKRFVKKSTPFSNSSYFYKTGDLGRWNNEGYLEFLGRNDQQVKIRGYRIELEEIENVIESIDGIKHAAVVVQGENSDKKIVCYINVEGTVQNSETVLSLINQRIESRLPKYMAPVDYMLINKIELTFNGKKDKTKLPAFVSYKEGKHENDITVFTETEKKVLGIFAKALDGKYQETKISLDDDFIEMGGNSLRLIYIIEGIQEKFGITCNIFEIADKLSVRKLSTFINTKSK